MENPEESAQEGYGAEDSVVSGLVKSLGETARQFEVKINFDIIRLFSEGLYQSPHKAIEELVSNSFDAGALNVHLLVPEPSDPAQSLWVIDDGSGMSHQELETLWEVANSPKVRPGAPRHRGRSPIGQFGIGKLAAYVMARRLTPNPPKEGVGLAS